MTRAGSTTALLSRQGSEVVRRIRAARSYAGLSVGELAEETGLGVQTIKRIEAGRRTARHYEVWAIAEACRLPRAFFEIEFEQLYNAAEISTAVLRQVERRLARIEAQLGISDPTSSTDDA